MNIACTVDMDTPARSQRIAYFAVLLLAAVGSPRAAWDIAPTLSFQETYTDNIALSAVNPENELVTEVRPAMNLVGENRAMNMRAMYGVTAIGYVARRDFVMHHNVDAAGHARFFKDVVAIDASAGLEQQILDPNGVISTDHAILTGNRTDVARGSITPALHWRFSTLTEARLDYTKERIRFRETDFGDSDIDTYTAAWWSGAESGRDTWRIDALQRHVRPRNGATLRTRDAHTGYRYRIAMPLIMQLGLGYEDVDIYGVRVPWQTAGEYWDAGLQWTPNPRVLISVGTGDRFYGRTYRGEFTLRNRRTDWRMTYDEQITSGERVLSEQLLRSGEAAAPLNTLEAVNSGQFIRRAAAFSASLEANRQRYAALFSAEHRKFIRSLPSERLAAGHLDWRYNATRHVTLRSGAALQVRDTAVRPMEFRLSADAAVRAVLGRRVNAELEYRHARYYPRVVPGYRQNQFIVRASVTY